MSKYWNGYQWKDQPTRPLSVETIEEATVAALVPWNLEATMSIKVDPIPESDAPAHVMLDPESVDFAQATAEFEAKLEEFKAQIPDVADSESLDDAALGDATVCREFVGLGKKCESCGVKRSKHPIEEMS